MYYDFFYTDELNGEVDTEMILLHNNFKDKVENMHQYIYSISAGKKIKNRRIRQKWPRIFFGRQCCWKIK